MVEDEPVGAGVRKIEIRAHLVSANFALSTIALFVNGRFYFPLAIVVIPPNNVAKLVDGVGVIVTLFIVV